jgi:ABC-type nickel/cobalt efflux system permease component RcnA
MMLYKRAMRLRGHGHDGHSHSHDHHHPHDHPHDHGPNGHSHVPEGDVTLGSLIALGASGGLVPCPSALVLLLSSVALGRVGLGMILLVSFSAGLAIVLMTIGVLVLYAKHLLPDSEKASQHPAFRLIPVFSAAVVMCIGLVMTGVSLGVIRPDRILGLT